MTDMNAIKSYPTVDTTTPRLVLNLDDPIENVVYRIVEMNRKKRSDYAHDGDIFSNFHEAAYSAGCSCLL